MLNEDFVHLFSKNKWKLFYFWNSKLLKFRHKIKRWKQLNSELFTTELKMILWYDLITYA